MLLERSSHGVFICNTKKMLSCWNLTNEGKDDGVLKRLLVGIDMYWPYIIHRIRTLCVNSQVFYVLKGCLFTS